MDKGIHLNLVIIQVTQREDKVLDIYMTQLAVAVALIMEQVEVVVLMRKVQIVLQVLLHK